MLSIFSIITLHRNQSKFIATKLGECTSALYPLKWANISPHYGDVVVCYLASLINKAATSFGMEIKGVWHPTIVMSNVFISI